MDRWVRARLPPHLNPVSPTAGLKSKGTVDSFRDAIGGLTLGSLGFSGEKSGNDGKYEHTRRSIMD
jgi:hypothetical protein